MTRLPPTRVAHAAAAVRTALQALTRRMVPPQIGLLELASGFMATHAIYAAGKLGLADLLAQGPLPAGQVAAKAGTDPDHTHRLLRACATFGVFSEDDEGHFALTPLGQGLRTGTPDSILPVILMLGDRRYQAPWGQLCRTVTTGMPSAEEALGKPFWPYLDHDREFAATFNQAMDRLCALDWPTIEAVYDFTRFSTIVDIGGGHGQLLARVLQASPSAKGVLLERAALLAEAEDHLRTAGVLNRCRIEPGSFFETAPSDGELYLLRRVLHDFDDGDAAAILTNVRRHMPGGSTLLLLESVVPPGNTPHVAKTLDLDMMLFVGGRERTKRQFTTLLEGAGLRLTRVIPTISSISLIEAVEESAQ